MLTLRKALAWRNTFTKVKLKLQENYFSLAIMSLTTKKSDSKVKKASHEKAISHTLTPKISKQKGTPKTQFSTGFNEKNCCLWFWLCGFRKVSTPTRSQVHWVCSPEKFGWCFFSLNEQKKNLIVWMNENLKKTGHVFC